jgi:hypothetical protein
MEYMNNLTLQIVFIAGILCFVGVILFFIRKSALSLKYSLLWLFSAFLMLTASIFPGVLRFIADVLRFELISNAVFSLVLGFAILILLSLTSIVSKQTEKIKTLVQTVTLLEKRVRELEGAESDEKYSAMRN